MVRINLLPIRSILRLRELKQFVILAVAALVSSLALMAAIWFYVDQKIQGLQTELKGKQSELSALKVKTKEIENLKNEIARLEKQVDSIQKLTKTRNTPAPFMSAVSLAVPDEVWINNISKQSQSFSLDGVGADNTVVVNFVNKLQQIRQGFTRKRPYIDKNNPDDKPFFQNIKLLQVVASNKPGGLAAVDFKITGTLR
jgi:Tfp pilus assembly protein PilN